MSKQRLITVVSFVSVIATVMLGLLLIDRVRIGLLQNISDQYVQQEKQVAEQTEDLLKSEIKSLQDKLQLVAKIPEVADPKDPALCNQKLNDANVLQVKVNNLGRVGPDGKFVCSLNTALIGTEAKNLGDYIPQIFNDPEHKPVLSHKILIPNLNTYAFALHIPVYNSAGEFSGTLGGAIYTSYLENNYFKNFNFAKEGYISIIDDNLDILYHPRAELAGKNFMSDEIQSLTGSNQELNNKIKNSLETGQVNTSRYKLNGEERIATYYPTNIFNGRKWLITVVVPVKDIESTFSEGGLTAYFALLAAMSVMAISIPPLVILVYLNRAVFNPINKMTGLIEKVSRGNFEQKLEYKATSDQDEIKQLVDAFNRMASELKDLYDNLNQKVNEQTEIIKTEKADLEKLVDERTAELKVAKENLEQEVNKRTEELSKSLEEVQQFNRLMIDRENKMIELKQHIQELENKLEGTASSQQ